MRSGKAEARTHSDSVTSCAADVDPRTPSIASKLQILVAAQGDLTLAGLWQDFFDRMLALLTALFVAAAPLPGDVSFTSFALVPLGKPAAVTDVKKAFAGLKNCKGKFDALKRSEYPDLSVIAMQGRWVGLSEADHAAVENAKEVVDVEILCTPFDLKKVRALDEAIATAAARTGSAVVSLQTIYAPAAFRDERIDHGWADGVPVAR